MRPLYVLLLAGTDHPRASGFFPSPSAFVASPFLQRTEQSRCGEASLELSRTTSSKRSRRVRQRSTSISSSTTAGCWRHTHHDGAWTCTAAAAGWQPPCNRRSGWTGPSASRAWGVQHAPPSCSAVGGSTFPPSSITTSSSSSSIRSSTRRRATRIEATAASSTSTSSIVAARRSAAEEAQTASLQQQETVEDEDDDPTAAAHGYLADFLGMTEEELQQLSAKYRSLPPGRRGPDEITVAGPDVAAAATEAAEAAAAAVMTAAAAATSDRSASSSSGEGRGEGVAEREEMAALRAAADKAAVTAAGRVLISEMPAIASMLHVQLGVPKERVKILLLKWPRLLEVSGLNAGHCVQWLTDTVGMTKEEVAKLFLAHPPILIKSVSFQLKPNLYWLENDLGLSRPEARKAVCTCPQLVVKSVPSNFLPKTEFFEETLGVGRAGVGRMLVRYPQLFNFSLENMKWKARWLEQELMLDPNQVKRVLTRCPSVFAYSAERNLVPTLEFFMDELGATKRQVRRAVSKQPRLLGMSLENRLVPRLQQIRKAGFTPAWELHHEVMLFASERVFLRWLAEEPTGAAQRRRKLQGGRSQTGRWRFSQTGAGLFGLGVEDSVPGRGVAGREG